ncbi:MAG TPA: hypothetical protein VGF98_09120 [Candidatus Tumulicola sp.]
MIDTSLMYCANPEATGEGGLVALVLMEIAIGRQFRIVLPSGLEEEWERHMSSWSTSWLAELESQRRVVRRFSVALDGAAENRLNQLVSYDFDGKAMQHEFKIIQAAASTDSAILCLDERARCFFSRAARREALIRDIVWRNPLETNLCPWLKGGAPARNEDRLRAHFCRRSHHANCVEGVN